MKIKKKPGTLKTAAGIFRFELPRQRWSAAVAEN